MSRKTTSLTFAGLSLVVLVALALLIPMPYVVMSPGVTQNTLGSYKGKPVIDITGHRTYHATGHLNLTTVLVTSPEPRLRLPDVVNAWLDPDRIVVPRDLVYPPSQSVGQVEQENTSEMLNSQTTAIVAALQELGIQALHVRVAKVMAGAPAAGLVHQGDEVTSVDGKTVTSAKQVVDSVGSLHPGATVTLGLRRRDGTTVSEPIVTAASPDDKSKARVGVELSDRFEPPFTVKFNPAIVHDIGGPSAGMMFSLGVYDMLTPGALTGGRFIAGTGTITIGGKVGPIGGIQQKIAGAYSSGATIFLVPAKDCSEAAGSNVADKVKLVRVATLDEAVHALKALKAGDDAAVTRCGQPGDGR